ncbi:MAG: 30S ribosomal protein S20 [Parcubacteria group bacterium]|nr:30S ribosomal protein S20 [Parcubacteria group bacterium]MBI3074647.1 30S ribosomal protein S20 [Parcubacteria group bacterium]
MAITTSAKKAIRTAARRKLFNDQRKKALRDTFKEVLNLAKKGSRAEAEALLPTAYKAIDKALKRGVIKKNTAARRKSRLARAVKN